MGKQTAQAKEVYWAAKLTELVSLAGNKFYNFDCK